MSFSPGHVRTAVLTMRQNRWRSLLTMFGVIVGVASVVTIIGISEGVKNQITNQVNVYSKDVITVSSRAANLNAFGVSSVPAVSTLTPQDVSAIANIRGVKASVPLEILSGQAKGDRIFHGAVVIATNQNLPLVLSQSLAFGTFFNNQDSNTYSAVLGANAATGLFRDSIPLGYSFNWRSQQFVVDGVLNNFSNTLFSNDTLYNNAIFIPINAANQMSLGNRSIYEILVRVTGSRLLPIVDKEINTALLATHSNQHDFTVLLPSQVAESNTGVLNLLTELIIGVAIISLFVGGVGIMNVMLVSVTERMHEIGIRKAVGASNRQILSQFLVEAITVSLIGGIIGIILALVANGAIRSLTNLSPTLNWQIMLIAVAISMGIGIIFGLVPAFRASRKEPIDALRND